MERIFLRMLVSFLQVLYSKLVCKYNSRVLSKCNEYICKQLFLQLLTKIITMLGNWPYIVDGMLINVTVLSLNLVLFTVRVHNKGTHTRITMQISTLYTFYTSTIAISVLVCSTDKLHRHIRTGTV